MDCDICGCSEPNGSVVSAQDMRGAATMGYNPYLVGFPAGSPMEFMAKRSSDPSSDIANWKHRTINASVSTSDWYVCSQCREKLRAFLSMAERAASIETNPLLMRSAFSTPVPPMPPVVQQSLPPLPSPPMLPVAPPSTPPQTPQAVQAPVVQPMPPPELALDIFQGDTASSPLPLPVTGPMTIEALREAITRTVKGVLIMVGVLIIKSVVFAFLNTTNNYRYTVQDWIALTVALFVSAYGVTLYKPVFAIVSHGLISNVNLGRLPAWCSHHVTNLTSALKYILLMLFLGLLYLVLMPNVSRFNQLILKADVITTVLNVLVVAVAVVMLLLAGKHLYPLIDFFAQRVTDHVVPIPAPANMYGATGSPEGHTGLGVSCPNCKVLNEPASLFCAYCGFSLLSPSSVVPPISDKKSCPGCSAQNDRSSRFCISCGTPL